MNSFALRSWNKLSSTGFGRWLFTRFVCYRAPYFASISPLIIELGVGRAVVTMRKRRKVKNHIGTVHVIAISNLCEIAAGTMTEVSTPADMRWIPKSMNIQYLAKAETSMTAIATVPPIESGDARDYIVAVDVHDENDKIVVHADISMYVSPRTR